jgi:hypothetical protein
MATIDFGSALSLKQAAKLIMACPENRIFLEGEPGIGKSSLMSYFAEHLPGYSIGYIDCGNLDLGDVAMPCVDHEKMVTNYAPNARFHLHEGKPVVIMLDEFTKAAPPVKNMLHPLLEVSNPRLGDIPLPAGSIVFLTGNLSSDGVGDSLPAHSRNRLTVVKVRKPDADQWLEWALTSGKIDPVIMAWARQVPHALASYTDEGQGDNPYIYNPKKGQKACVSPRSLERGSNIVARRDHLGPEVVIAALAGTLGESAARDIQAYIDYQDELPSWDNVVTNPGDAPVPKSPGACAVMVYGAIAKIDKGTITPFMKYLDRFDPEWQAAFAINVAKAPGKQSIAFSSKAFADWVQDNEDLL